jgi:hypothetical protein
MGGHNVLAVADEGHVLLAEALGVLSLVDAIIRL